VHEVGDIRLNSEQGWSLSDRYGHPIDSDDSSMIAEVMSRATMFISDYLVRVGPHILSGDPAVVHGTVWPCCTPL
jgi:hypothetical protein